MKSHGFFKPEDISQQLNLGMNIQDLCDLLNAKLEREGKVVYSLGEPNWRWYTTRNDNTQGTHTALLIDIQPIETCTHPSEKVKLDTTKRARGWNDRDLRFETTSWEAVYQCNCGARVKVKRDGFEVCE